LRIVIEIEAREGRSEDVVGRQRAVHQVSICREQKMTANPFGIAFCRRARENICDSHLLKLPIPACRPAAHLCGVDKIRLLETDSEQQFLRWCGVHLCGEQRKSRNNVRSESFGSASSLGISHSSLVLCENVFVNNRHRLVSSSQTKGSV